MLLSKTGCATKKRWGLSQHLTQRERTVLKVVKNKQSRHQNREEFNRRRRQRYSHKSLAARLHKKIADAKQRVVDKIESITKPPPGRTSAEIEALLEQHAKRRTSILRVRNALRCRLRSALRANYTLKLEGTMDLAGCSTDFLRGYLEAKFKRGMSWENYGKWHIDHIRPCASFDLRNPEERKKCFHYSNLQPLWASDNCRKNARGFRKVC